MYAFTYFHRLNDTMSWILLKPSGTLQVGPLSTLISFGPIEPLFKVRLQPLLNFCQNFLEKSSTLKTTITPPFMDGFSTSWRLFRSLDWEFSDGTLRFWISWKLRPLRPLEPFLQKWKLLQYMFEFRPQIQILYVFILYWSAIKRAASNSNMYWRRGQKVSQTLNIVFFGHYQGNLWLTFPLMKPNVVPDGYCKVLKPPASKFFLTSTGL